MAKKPKNIAASVRHKLLNLSRTEGRSFDTVLFAFGLERFIYRLSLSSYRNRFVLKGGMLVIFFTKNKGRTTRDVDLLSFGEINQVDMKNTIAEILAIDVNDGIVFDTVNLKVTPIKEDQIYGGLRIKTTAYLEKTTIPITIDVGFGDAILNPDYMIDYGSMLDFPSASIRTYSPETIIAEKFEAIIKLGESNTRMKDYYDLWMLPKSINLDPDKLQASILATFKRRRTEIPEERPPGLSYEFAANEEKLKQWGKYCIKSRLEDINLAQVVDDIWNGLEPFCIHQFRDETDDFNEGP